MPAQELRPELIRQTETVALRLNDLFGRLNFQELSYLLNNSLAFSTLVESVRTHTSDPVTSERDRLKEGLLEIAHHSVCCDARHVAEAVLSGKAIPSND